MSGPIYIANFDFRGRCPENEKDKRGEYAVRLGQFQDAPGGKLVPVESDVMTPTQAEKAGWSLDAIMNEIARQAVADMEAANTERNSAVERMTKAQEDRATAINELKALEKAATEAVAAAATAQRNAESAAAEARAERDQIAAAALHTVNALREELTAVKAEKAALLQAAVDAAEPAV